VRDGLARHAEANPGFFLPLGGESLPVDTRHNAKIQREKLAERAARNPKGNLA
jgi:hypothetical protein